MKSLTNYVGILLVCVMIALMGKGWSNEEEVMAMEIKGVVLKMEVVQNEQPAVQYYIQTIEDEKVILIPQNLVVSAKIDQLQVKDKVYIFSVKAKIQKNEETGEKNIILLEINKVVPAE